MSPHTQDLWIPRDDMAVLARCSVDTIKRDEKKVEALYRAENRTYEPRTDEAGRVLVHAADFIRIGRIRPEDLATGTTPAESAELARARDLIVQLKVQVADLAGRLSRADTELTDRNDQLTAKDRQLTASARQLDRQAAHIDALIDTIRRNGGAA